MEKIKKTTITILMLILISVSVYAATLEEFQITDSKWADNFDYPGVSFTLRPDLNDHHNWSISSAGCPGGTVPLINTYGVNQTCAAGVTRSLETQTANGGMGVTFTNDIVLMEYDLNIVNISGSGNAALRIELYPFGAVVPKLTLYHADFNDTDPLYRATVFLSGGGTGANCTLTNGSQFGEGFNGTLNLVLNQPADTFSWYINNESGGCEGVSLVGSGIDGSFNALQITNEYNTDEKIEVYFDELNIGLGTASSSADDSTPAGAEPITELEDAVDSIWEDFGIRTTTSKVMTGVFLMFILALFIYGAGLSTGMHVSPITLGIIELFFMIILVYLELIPIWIPVIVVILVVGIGAIFIVKTATSHG